MSINLADLPSAVSDYLSTKVTTTITSIVPDKAGDTSFEPGDDGHFTVTFTNAASPDGVRLVNVRYHVSISPSDVALLTVPGTQALPNASTHSAVSPSRLIARDQLDDGSKVLKAGALVDHMFIQNTSDDTLDVGDADSVTLHLHCNDGEKTGTVTVSCHIHGDVDEASLFATTSTSHQETNTFKVK